MASNYLINLTKYDSLTFDFLVKSNESKQSYSISYHSNVEFHEQQYQLRYTSYFPSPFTAQYSIYYTSIYGDALQTYRIRYLTGREPKEIIDRYYIRYMSLYTSTSYATYSIRYITTGASTEPQRIRYKIKYTSEKAGNFTQTYKIKYSTSTFYEHFSKYTIKYNSTGAEEILLRSVLLRNNSSTDALIEIRGIFDKSIEEYLFVISNMPKYQTLEYRVGEELPYLTYLPASSAGEQDIFDNDGVTSYTVRGYLLLSDVEDLNGLSVDVYDVNNDYKKINRSKTYFFGLEPTDYIESLISLDERIYYFINRSSEYYNVKYLNYISASITPTFRFGIDCCFSRKINKTNYSYCSPF